MLFHRQHVMHVSNRRAMVIDALTSSHFLRAAAAAPHGTMRLPAPLYRANDALISWRRQAALSTSAAAAADE